MVFSGLTFLLLFLPLLLGLYFISGNIHWRNGVLVLFSLLFYAWGEPVMVWLMVLATLVNYLCGLGIAACPSRHGRRLWLLLGAVVSLAGLVYFKYAGFLLESLGKLLHISLSFQAPALPIGISFYTFQILTYTVDVYRKKVPVQKNFFRLLLYVSCFPQLIAGPIVQYGDIAGALEKRTSNLKSFTDGMDRFFVGLAKKVLLANVCGAALEGCTLGGGKDPLSLGGAWLGALLYTLQLYYDFPLIRIWLSDWEKCWGSHIKRTSSTRISVCRLRNSGGAGTFLLELFSGIMYISLWAATDGGGCGPR